MIIEINNNYLDKQIAFLVGQDITLVLRFNSVFHMFQRIPSFAVNNEMPPKSVQLSGKHNRPTAKTTVG